MIVKKQTIQISINKREDKKNTLIYSDHLKYNKLDWKESITGKVPASQVADTDLLAVYIKIDFPNPTRSEHARFDPKVTS